MQSRKSRHASNDTPGASSGARGRTTVAVSSGAFGLRNRSLRPPFIPTGPVETIERASLAHSREDRQVAGIRREDRFNWLGHLERRRSCSRRFRKAASGWSRSRAAGKGAGVQLVASGPGERPAIVWCEKADSNTETVERAPAPTRWQSRLRWLPKYPCVSGRSSRQFVSWDRRPSASRRH